MRRKHKISEGGRRERDAAHKRAPVQEEICASLAQWKTPGAIEPLLKLLNVESGMTSLFRQNANEVPEKLRSRAALALAPFIGDKEVFKALQRALQDKSPVVQAAARAVFASPAARTTPAAGIASEFGSPRLRTD